MMTSQLSQFKDFLEVSVVRTAYIRPWLMLAQYLATVKGDLSNITAPPFVLSTKSVTEIPAAWAEHQDLFLGTTAAETPELRALAILKNFLCSLRRQQYTGRSEEDGIKKPLNAFLGEIFIGEFQSKDGSEDTKIISEQVSHHPPVTASYLWNEKHGVSAEGYVAQETTFSPTTGVTVEQLGHAIIRLEAHDEEYLMTLPTLHIKGLVTGSPYPELQGSMHIVSSTGYTAQISFEGKKMLGLGGKKHVVDALLYRTDDGPEHPLYEVQGHWNEKMTVKVVDEKSDNRGKVVDEYDVRELATTPLAVTAVEKQSPWESRRAWAPTVAGIESRDMTATSEEKSKIEKGQRALRQQYPEVTQDGNQEWQRVFFRREEADEAFERLAAPIGETLGSDLTAGVWRFRGRQEANRAVQERAFHEGILPTGEVKSGAV